MELFSIKRKNDVYSIIKEIDDLPLTIHILNQATAHTSPYCLSTGETNIIFFKIKNDVLNCFV